MAGTSACERAPTSTRAGPSRRGDGGGRRAAPRCAVERQRYGRASGRARLAGHEPRAARRAPRPRRMPRLLPAPAAPHRQGWPAAPVALLRMVGEHRALASLPPLVQPEIHIGPLDLQTFGICFALGFLAAGAIVSRRLRELGKPRDWAYEIVFAALIGGLVGSRVDYLIQNWDEVSDDLLGNIFSGSGLVWFGGLVGGALGVVLWALLARLADLADARRLLRPAGRRLRDRPDRLPALGRRRLRHRVRPALGDGVPGRHRADHRGGAPDARSTRRSPMGIGALVLWHLRDRFAPGVLFGLYLILAGGERFLVEFIRRNDAVVAGLTQPQLISLALLALGAAIVLVRRDAPRARARVGSAAPERGRARRAPAPPRRRRRCRRGTRSRCRPRRPARATRGAGEHRPAGRARVPAHRHRRRHEHGQHQQGAEALHGDGDGEREQRPAARGAAAPGAAPSAAAPALSNASGRERAVQRGERDAAGREQDAPRRPGRASVTPSGSPNSSSSRRCGRVRREREQRAQPEQPGDGDGGAGVGADPLVARGERDQRGGGERAARGAEQQRRARRAPRARAPAAARGRATRRVGEPLGHDPEPERAAERAEQRDLEQRAPADAGLERVEEEVEDLHSVVAVLVVLDRDGAARAALLEHDDLAAVGGLERARGRAPRPGGPKATWRPLQAEHAVERRGRSRRRGSRRAACGPRRAARRTAPAIASALAGSTPDERLVEQQHARVLHERAGEQRALALAAGQLAEARCPRGRRGPRARAPAAAAARSARARRQPPAPARERAHQRDVERR